MITRLFALFDRFGAEHYGENVSQLDHALQCAQLAREHGCSDALVAAALLHDIGAAVLQSEFSAEVTEPIRLHVEAKRYLCAIDARYAAGLSAASILSLGVQGGAMSAAERQRFEEEPFFAEAVQLRRFDDWGKREGCPVALLESYRPMLESLRIRAG
jgi:predicted HD phosphohydrolase